jgi:putative transposase
LDLSYDHRIINGADAARFVNAYRKFISLQKFVSVHASVCNHFNQERHLYSRANFKLNRTAALAEWRQVGAA